MLSFVAVFLALGASPPRPTGSISEVVVYQDRAAVTRRQRVTCAGVVTARFSGITPAADKASFRPEVQGGNITGLRAFQRERTDAFSPRVTALDERLRRVAAEVTAAEAELARINAGAESGEAFRAVTEERVTGELTAGKLDLAAWRTALETVLDTGLVAARARTPVDVRLRALAGERKRLEEERAALAAAARRTEYQVEVEITCPAGGEATLSLVYTVGGAAWTPSYEARLDEASASLELATFATVQQATGEDWRGARLLLSTAVPRQSATPPELAPLAVFAEEREAPRQQIVARSEPIRHAQTADARAAGNTSTGTALRAAGQGVSVRLELPAPADVPGDGTPVRLLVARNRLGAQVHLRTSPRLAPYVFRMADAFNGAPFALAPGPVDVYRGGSFVARQTLDEIPRGGRFTVSLGVDERVRASRLILEESEQKLGLFGRTRQHRFGYRLRVTSHLEAPEEVELCDQLPVSELDDVKVVVDPRTTAGYTLDARDGIVRWKWRLSPREWRTADLVFQVEVPSSLE
jgi:uncharacterized protein (TIGR02231 family)